MIPNTPTDTQITKARKDAIKENDCHFNYADRLLALNLREKAGFGAKRFEEYNRISYQMGREYIEKYAQSDKDEADYAVDSYYALRRDLRDLCGWIAEDELWHDSIFETFPADENSARIRRIRENRIGYAKGIGFYVRQQLCMAAIYLYTHLGWAKVRLGYVLHPVRDGYLEFMRQYLRCSKAGDAEMKRMHADVRRRYNAMGIFEEVYN
jgi:hypothetical protein